VDCEIQWEVDVAYRYEKLGTELISYLKKLIRVVVDIWGLNEWVLKSWLWDIETG
jgi:hypothetical protein